MRQQPTLDFEEKSAASPGEPAQTAARRDHAMAGKRQNQRRPGRRAIGARRRRPGTVFP
jgi:hypothetical protein